MSASCTPYTPPECREFCNLVDIREDSLAEYTRVLGVFLTVRVAGVYAPSKYSVTKDIRKYMELIQLRPLDKASEVIELITYLETPFTNTKLDNCYRAILKRFLEHYAEKIKNLSPQMAEKLTNMLLDAIYSIASTYNLLREQKDMLFSILKTSRRE